MTIIIPDPPGGSSSPAGPNVALALAEQRRATDIFISVFPHVIVFTPRAKERKPAGGFVWVDQPPRDPQTFTIVEPGASPVPTVTLDGIERRIDMEIVGSWNAVVAQHDTFELLGRSWEVVDLFLDNGYETRAWVSGRA